MSSQFPPSSFFPPPPLLSPEEEEENLAIILRPDLTSRLGRLLNEEVELEVRGGGGVELKKARVIPLAVRAEPLGVLRDLRKRGWCEEKEELQRSRLFRATPRTELSWERRRIITHEIEAVPKNELAEPGGSGV